MALDNAVTRGGDAAGCILHSDRGSQFRSRKLQRALTAHRMVGSMGQVGSAGDNAAMDCSSLSCKKNVLDRQRWDTRDELRLAIVTWIERTYHRQRRQTPLGRLTPIEFEAIIKPPPPRRPDPTSHLSPDHAAAPTLRVDHPRQRRCRDVDRQRGEGALPQRHPVRGRVPCRCLGAADALDEVRRAAWKSHCGQLSPVDYEAPPLARTNPSSCMTAIGLQTQPPDAI